MAAVRIPRASRVPASRSGASASPSSSSRRRPRRWNRRCGRRSRGSRRSRRPSCRSPTAPAARPASAPTRRSSASSPRRRSRPRRISPASTPPAPRSMRWSAPMWRPASATSWRCAAIRPAASASATRRTPTATATPPIWSPASSGIADFEMSVSAYPEKHPDSPSVEADIDMLRRKVDAGATRAITQFFFDNDLYFRYLDRVRAARHHHPDRARHPAGAEFHADARVRRALRHQRAGLARRPLRRASTTMPRRASWSPRRSRPSRCSTWSIAASPTSTSTP